MPLRKLLGRFRAINIRLNEQTFGDTANTYRHYLQWVERRSPPSGVILALGAGQVPADPKPREAEKGGPLRIAVDKEADSLKRNSTALRVVADAESLPFGHETVDLLTASCFFEHVEHPQRVISECYRILKKGGSLVFYTPHRRSYVAFLARLTPLSFHRWIRMLQTGQPAHETEVCPTFYRMNTPSDLIRFAGDFRLLSMDVYIGEPCYSIFLPPFLHGFFILFHQVVQRAPWLRKRFGENLIGCMIKSHEPAI